MTTYPLNLQELLKRGLRSASYAGVNQPVFDSLTNLFPTEVGLKQWSEAVNPWDTLFSSLLTYEYPFPQIFVGKRYTLFCQKDTIYKVESGYTLTEWDVVDGYTGASSAIKPGGVWHFADMGDAFILFNGVSIVYKDNAPPYGTGDSLKVVSDVTIGSGAYFRGRIISGGFTPSEGWKGALRSQLDTAKTLNAYFAAIDANLNPQVVLWSTVGQSDLAFRWLIHPEEMATGYVSGVTGSDLWHDAFARNEFGIMPIPSQGKILAVVPLGGEKGMDRGGVIVASETGIYVLIPVADPVPTFALRELHTVGLAERGAICSVDDAVYLVDRNGVLLKIGLDYKIEPLGYDQYLKDKREWSLSAVINPVRRRLVCSWDSGSLLISESGAGEISRPISTLAMIERKLVAVSEPLHNRVEGITGEINAGNPYLKYIVGVRVVANTLDNLLVKAVYKQRIGGAPYESEWVPVNDAGYAVLGITATVFSIKFKILGCTDFHLEDLTVYYQAEDQRHKRGPSQDDSSNPTQSD